LRNIRHRLRSTCVEWPFQFPSKGSESAEPATSTFPRNFSSFPEQNIVVMIAIYHQATKNLYHRQWIFH
jgi:hypothetical protein